MTLRNEIEDFLRKFGAFKVGVADPEQGFKTAENGCHPRDVMEKCNSVIVFAFHVGLDYYTTLDYCQKGDVESRLLNIYRAGSLSSLFTSLKTWVTKRFFLTATWMKRRESLVYP